MKYFKINFLLGVIFVLFMTTYVFASSSPLPESFTDDPSNFVSNSSCGSIVNITDFFNYGLCVLDSGIIPLLISVGLVIFIAGIVKFVSAGDNEEKRQGGRNMMIFGIIALFVMVSVWGFVNVLSKSFFGKNSEIQSLPKKSGTLYATN